MNTTIVFVNKTTPELVENMWQIYQQYYACERRFFVSRLPNHNAFALFLCDNRLVGFTGIKRLKTRLENGKKALLLGLAITAINRDFRNQGLIEKTVVTLYCRERLKHPFLPIYNWSTAASYKPYLMFANNLKEYYPNATNIQSSFYQHLEKVIFDNYFQGCEIDNGVVYQQGFRITDNSVLLCTYRNTSNAAFVFYKQRYEGSRPLKRMEVKCICTIAPTNLKNLCYWLGRFTQKQFKKIIKPTYRLSTK